MGDFLTERLEPTSGGGAISGQTDQRDLPSRPPRRHQSKPATSSEPGEEPVAPDEPSHRVDQLA